MVERGTHNPSVLGSNPSGSTNCFQRLSLLLLTGLFGIVPDSVPFPSVTGGTCLLFKATNRSFFRLRPNMTAARADKGIQKCSNSLITLIVYPQRRIAVATLLSRPLQYCGPGAI